MTVLMSVCMSGIWNMRVSQFPSCLRGQTQLSFQPIDYPIKPDVFPQIRK
jgi:hypothetical protein